MGPIHGPLHTDPWNQRMNRDRIKDQLEVRPQNRPSQVCLQKELFQAVRELVLFEVEEAECWEGLHLSTKITSLDRFTCRPLSGLYWRMQAGVHGKAGSNPVSGPPVLRRSGKLSSTLVASTECLRRMAALRRKCEHTMSRARAGQIKTKLAGSGAVPRSSRKQ